MTTSALLGLSEFFFKSQGASDSKENLPKSYSSQDCSVAKDGDEVSCGNYVRQGSDEGNLQTHKPKQETPPTIHAKRNGQSLQFLS